MAILSVLGFIFSISALLFCVYLYLELLKKPSGADIPKALASYSEELKQTYGRSVKEIETEWADMYSKFMRIAGRMDKTKALENPPHPPAAAPIVKRSDLLRKHRGGMLNE